MASEEQTMPSQLTVRLPDDLDQALKAATRRMQRRSSDIVRLALREFLGSQGRPRGRPIDRVRGLLGSLESGVSDLAVRHREHILRSLTRRSPTRGG
jgi:Ribbon-helix-helix protein, copG family